MVRAALRRLLLFAVVFVPTSAHAGEKALPADLAIVPPDALGFLHVRVADLWKSEHFKEWRSTILKAGDKALTTFDERFLPRPSSLERITVVIVAAKDKQAKPPEEPVVIINTSKAIDRMAFAKHSVPGAQEENVNGKTLLVDAKTKTEIYFLDDRNLVVGPIGAVRRLLGQPRPASGNLSEALKQANSGQALVLALNVQALPANALREVPPAFQPLAKAKSASLALDLRQQGQIDLRLVYANADETDAAETAAKEGIKLARSFIAKGRMELQKKVLGDGKPGSLEELPEAAGSLFGLGMINRLEEYLAAAPVQKEGNQLHLALKLPQGGQAVFTAAAISSALLVPAVQKVREAASRAQGMNNLKQIGLAMHSHLDQKRTLPAAAICDAAGKPLLSWRVAILPYIDQQQLYNQFKLDEPWNSAHNIKLLPLMPKSYVIPAVVPKEGQTHYRVFVGGGAGFEWCQDLKPAAYTDGFSNTLMVVEAAESVPWTQPDELVYDAKKPLPKMGNFYGNGSYSVLFFDGTVRTMSSAVTQDVLRALITRAGGEAIGLDK